MAAPYEGDSAELLIPGLTGKSTATNSGIGVQGLGWGPGGTGVAGAGYGMGVEGTTIPQSGTTGTGVLGIGGAMGVRGFAFLDISTGRSAEGFLGGKDPIVQQLAGVFGGSDQQGVFGTSYLATGTGVYGGNTTGGGWGVRGETNTGIAVEGKSYGSGLAGNFVGNVNVSGTVNSAGHIYAGADIKVTGDVYLTNRDICERFAVAPATEFTPGMVMVVEDDGRLAPCTQAYDRRVVGVISGAGTLRPAITLGATDNAEPEVPISLVGTAFCLVDADEGGIQIGDLLTSSDKPGHARKAADIPHRSGSVIGKALRPLSSGQGLIPIVISIQ